MIQNKIKLNLYGTTWLHENYRKLYKKTKLCSIITSNKKIFKGHKMRHTICDFMEDPHGRFGKNSRIMQMEIV